MPYWSLSHWKSKLLVLLTIMILGFDFSPSKAYAITAGFTEEDITFESGDGEFKEELSGKVFIPDNPGPHPGIILVHGSGSQKVRRLEAEAFVKSGLIVLTYNKRTKGYSQMNRSFSLLAEDVISGVNVLKSRSDTDADRIGVWGVSEGGWVAPLAATLTDDIKFVITVGAPGMTPLQQQEWNIENRMQHHGIKSEAIYTSVRKASKVLMYSLLQALSESKAMLYDPIPPLQKLKQPILAIWGSNDRQVPPAESAQIFKENLEIGGNRQYTIQFLEGAGHSGYTTTDDGFVQNNELYPGYIESVNSWLEQVFDGHSPIAQIKGQTPVQLRHSLPEIMQLHWYERYQVQLCLALILLTAFIGYLVGGLSRFFKRTVSTPPPFKWTARTTAVGGLVSVIGFWSYEFHIISGGGRDVGPVIAGQPLFWILLQLLAFATVGCTIFIAVSWYRKHKQLMTQRRLCLMLLGGIFYIPWALQWQLFSLFY
ncbi:alpha/beta hydrolase family protein [Pseudalkalibacillus salsuginis]|uniref:alpha/beta hydrolase family protein n=1 Tax=Pseudalkalibacillus salsuginis TaxID=2910972 RepID=UPI001F313D5E|nr:prolyl oligopeptidase family serine peptidase [Pseudalkalibacillus salsuginis]MCF6410823.1 prolyl oligopeptidase family serine peptidase [Pseudalkalibacillus salsuginis]